MNSVAKSGTFSKLNIVSIIIITLCLFIAFKFYFSSIIILHTQAPNYGDVKLEIYDGNQVIETSSFLINQKHQIYIKKVNQIPENGELRFYFDTRHKTFISKGVLLIGQNFNPEWVGPSRLSDNASLHHVNKINNTRFTALFEGFGESAYFKIDTKLTTSNLFTPLMISLTCAVLVLLIGTLISYLIVKIELLNQHKLKLLVAALIFVVFFTYNPLKSIMLFCTFFWTGYYLFKYQTILLKNPGNLLAGLFLGIIFIGFAAQSNLLKTLKNEIQDNDLPIEADFFEQFGNRFSKHFNLKKEITHINSQIKVDVFQRSPTTKVIVGKQGTMFEGTGERRIEGDKIDFFDNVSDYLGRLPFHDGELEHWETAIKQRNCWLSEQGIKYLFAIAPTKALVYPELLPDVLSELNSKNKSSRIELLDAQLKQNNNLPYLNLTQPLLAAKEKHDDHKLFYRTDFHWNYLGAYYAYKAIIDKLSNASGTDLQAIPLDKFSLEVNPNWAHQNFLGLLGLLPKWYNNEHYIKLVPNAGNPLKNINPYGSEGIYDIKIPTQIISAKSGTMHSVEYIENPNGENRKILVIGDSFIQKVFPFISSHGKHNYFSRAVFHFPHELIQALKPDIVIQEILNMYLLRKPPINPEAIQSSSCP